MDTALLVNTVVSLALLTTASAGAQDAKQSTIQVVEIRSYNLKPGARDQFHQVFEREALPMLRRWKVDVVAYGPSLHDNESYFLIRGFPGVEERQRSEDAFYSSDEWRQGPREAVLAAIISYTTIVVRVDESTLNALRRTGGANPSASATGNAEKGNAMHTKTASS